jgi:hypothetical protein
MKIAIMILALLSVTATAQAEPPVSAQKIWASETLKQAAATAQAADELGLFLEREEWDGTLPGPTADLLDVLRTEAISLRTTLGTAQNAPLTDADISRLRAAMLALQNLAIEASSAYPPARAYSLTLAQNDLARVRAFVTQAKTENGPTPPLLIADGLRAADDSLSRADAALARLPGTTSADEWTAVRRDAAHWIDDAATRLADAFLRQERSPGAAVPVQ